MGSVYVNQGSLMLFKLRFGNSTSWVILMAWYLFMWANKKKKVMNFSSSSSSSYRQVDTVHYREELENALR